MESSIFIKRLTRDIKILKDSNLEENGIYFVIDEKNVTDIKCMIIGPEDTPYAYGYYFFNIKITSEYPFEPPKVKFITNSNVRFNPNLYTCGKVCVSILNTWSGPQWTSCLNLKSVLLSLQTLLNKNPLENEPGFEQSLNERHHNYISIIQHENLKISIIETLNQIKSEPFKEFESIIINQFLKNYSIIKKLGIQYKKQYQECQIFKLDIYNLNINNDYKILLEKIEKLEKTYNKLNKSIVNVAIDNEPEQPFKRKKKYIPNLKATDFELGYQYRSENCNYLYQVTLNNFNHKVWKRIK